MAFVGPAQMSELAAFLETLSLSSALGVFEEEELDVRTLRWMAEDPDADFGESMSELGLDASATEVLRRALRGDSDHPPVAVGDAEAADGASSNAAPNEPAAAAAFTTPIAGPTMPAAEPPPLVGRRVRISGLVGRADLNGRCGLALYFQLEKGRYTVRIEGTGEEVNVKSTNLAAAIGAAPTPTVAPATASAVAAPEAPEPSAAPITLPTLAPEPVPASASASASGTTRTEVYGASGDRYVGEFKPGTRKKHGKGTYYHADGRVEVGCHREGRDEGEGVQWSADRSKAWRLDYGDPEVEITLEEADAIAARIGLPMPPPAPGPTPEEKAAAEEARRVAKAAAAAAAKEAERAAAIKEAEERRALLALQSMARASAAPSAVPSAAAVAAAPAANPAAAAASAVAKVTTGPSYVPGMTKNGMRMVPAAKGEDVVSALQAVGALHKPALPAADARGGGGDRGGNRSDRGGGGGAVASAVAAAVASNATPPPTGDGPTADSEMRARPVAPGGNGSTVSTALAIAEHALQVVEALQDFTDDEPSGPSKPVVHSRTQINHVAPQRSTGYSVDRGTSNAALQAYKRRQVHDERRGKGAGVLHLDEGTMGSDEAKARLERDEKMMKATGVNPWLNPNKDAI